MERTRGRGQRGQMLLVAALSMAVLLGFTAMAIDVGLAYQDRRDLQKDVDAAALAGVQHLPLSPIAATDAANTWLLKNNVEDWQVTSITVESTLSANDTIRVEVDDEFGWVFGRVLGMTTSNIGAHAKARVGSLEGNGHMLPWAILQGHTDCLAIDGTAIWGQQCTVKVGAGYSISGWYGALDYDGGGGGSSEYEANIVDGTVDTVYCAEGDFVDPCPGTSIVPDLDGNKVGGTDDGIDTRLANGPACDDNGNGVDDFDEVFMPDPSGLTEYIVICPDSPNIGVIPIVSTNEDPVHEVTIEGWTLVYLQGYECSSASAVPIGGGDYVFAFDDVRVVASETCEKKAPRNTAMAPPELTDASDLYVRDPRSGALPAPAACHGGLPHGQQQCTPTPTPVATPSPVPTATPVPTASPVPTDTPTPGPPTATPAPGTPAPTPIPNPGGPNCNGHGHWEVHIQIVNATYSQINGYMGAYDPTKGVTIRRLIE